MREDREALDERLDALRGEFDTKLKELKAGIDTKLNEAGPRRPAVQPPPRWHVERERSAQSPVSLRRRQDAVASQEGQQLTGHI